MTLALNCLSTLPAELSCFLIWYCDVNNLTTFHQLPRPIPKFPKVLAIVALPSTPIKQQTTHPDKINSHEVIEV
jgi:hypothetical protein